MVDVPTILQRVRARGANVMIDGGKLIVINKAKLPHGALDFIRQHGRAIAQFIEKEGEFEERAAIIEFDGGFSRKEADDIARLLLSSPPKDCNPADWTWFVGKASEIIDAGRRAA